MLHISNKSQKNIKVLIFFFQSKIVRRNQTEAILNRGQSLSSQEISSSLTDILVGRLRQECSLSKSPSHSSVTQPMGAR